MSVKNVLWASAFIATGGFLFGYMIGINSNVITKGQLLCADGSDAEAGTWGSWGYGQCYNVSALTVGILSSLNLIGAVTSTILCFRYADNMGRKLEVQVASILYLLGSVITAVSPVLWGIAAGIFVYGLGIGFAMHAAPIYLAEISPPEIRGALVSGKEALIVLGIFLGFASGAGFSSIGSSGWRYMIASAIPFTITMFFGIATVPQSPRFLAIEVGRGNKSAEDVSAALQYYRAAEAAEVDDEVQMMLADVPDEKTLLDNTARRQVGAFEAFRYPRPLVIGCGLVFLQQITGQPSVLYFSTNVFKSAGFGANASAASVAVGLVKLLATLFTVWRVDSYGRRVLLLVGIAMMVVALALVGTSFAHTECSDAGVPVSDCDQDKVTLQKDWAYTAVAGLMLYVSGYQVGFGPISWVVISEIFPLNVRGSALSIAAIVNFGTNIVVTAVQPLLLETLQPAGLFFGFLVLSVLSFVFVAVGVPETKGLSLEEIETMMKE